MANEAHEHGVVLPGLQRGQRALYPGAAFCRHFDRACHTVFERPGKSAAVEVTRREPQAVAVKTGASDGRFTELKSGDIQPGERVVIDAVSVKQ